MQSSSGQPGILNFSKKGDNPLWDVAFPDPTSSLCQGVRIKMIPVVGCRLPASSQATTDNNCEYEF